MLQNFKFLCLVGVIVLVTSQMDKRRYSINQPNENKRKNSNNAPKNDITTEFAAKSIHKHKSNSNKCNHTRTYAYVMLLHFSTATLSPRSSFAIDTLAHNHNLTNK
jgi:hypothetical protein